MPVLTPAKPVTQREPELLIENQFAAGRYRFQLVVVDDAGLESAAAELVVEVVAPPRRPLRPDVLEPVDRPVLRPDLVRPVRP